MLKLKKVAITGYLSSGKTVVSSFFLEYDSFIINADKLVHEILSSSQPHIDKVISLFGDGIHDNGLLNRSKIADIVFSDPEKLEQLEQIIHPEIKNKIITMFHKEQSQNYSFFVVDFPLLYKVGMQSWFDVVIAVTAPKEKRRQFFLQKGFSDKQFDLRSQALINHDQAIMKADFILTNDGSIEALKQQTKTVINLLTQKK